MVEPCLSIPFRGFFEICVYKPFNTIHWCDKLTNTKEKHRNSFNIFSRFWCVSYRIHHGWNYARFKFILWSINRAYCWSVYFIYSIALTFSPNRTLKILSSFKCKNSINENILIRDYAYHLLRCGIIEICIGTNYYVWMLQCKTHDKFCYWHTGFYGVPNLLHNNRIRTFIIS